MSEELSQLINALKRDGVEAGESEAKKIRENAEVEVKRVLVDAKKEAQDIVNKAITESKNEKENLDKQLKLASRDFFLNVRQELTEKLALKPVRDAVGEELKNPAFLKQLIQRMVVAYAEADVSRDRKQLEITVPADMEKQFVEDWRQLMHEGLASVPILHLKEGQKGFRLSLNENGEIVIDDEALMESLKPFITERFQKLFVEEEKSKIQIPNPK
ncbi:MAG: hypothetical protein ABIE74_11470 [Pseudomonadota bacterium]